MYIGKLVFSQIIDHLPMHTFRRCVQRYRGNRKIKRFSCLDQYLCMAFAQFTYRESLRDIETCFRAQHNKLYHMGIRAAVSRHTLSNANKVRDWCICADLAQSLIPIARGLYIDEDFGVEFDQTVYALDATTIGLRCDQSIVLTGFYPVKDYPMKLRRIKYHDAETNKTFVFLTNNFALPALTIAELYRCRWQVELFFKRVKQHLRIKVFYGTMENAVKTQIWIAVSVYVLVAIIKKRLRLEANCYTILQILSVTIFERTSLLQVLTNADCTIEDYGTPNQLTLFD
jgi:hypothetical protein|tara:strand:+ start:84 stop:941 length:858 start_codon:yes stop_codon:yes gene_type:complete